MSGGDIARTAEIEWVRLAEQATIDQASADHVNLGLLDDGTVVFVDESDVVHVLAEVGAAGLYDAADITYTPTTAADWDSDADPGDLDDALNQLAERVTDIEEAGYLTAVDSDDVTYTPTTVTDWDGDADPGDVEQALDQLAERVDDIETRTDKVNFIIDGGGSAITTGIKGFIEFPACTITAWRLLADQSGAIKVDLWVDTYANFPPTDADSITNGHEPEIAASAAKAEDTDIADWSGEAVAAGGIMAVNVDSCATITRCTLALTVLRT